MGFWYLLTLITGVFLFVKITCFSKGRKSRALPILSVVLVLFSLFMFSPFSIKLIDMLFP